MSLIFIEVNVSINFDINLKENLFISMILVKTAKAITRLSRFIIFKLRHFVQFRLILCPVFFVYSLISLAGKFEISPFHRVPISGFTFEKNSLINFVPGNEILAPCGIVFPNFEVFELVNFDLFGLNPVVLVSPTVSLFLFPPLEVFFATTSSILSLFCALDFDSKNLNMLG